MSADPAKRQQDSLHPDSENRDMPMIDDYLDPVTARLLREAFGGSRINIPKQRTGTAWTRLCDALGEDRAGLVVRCFGGESLAVPMSHDGKIKDVVLALRKEGMSASEIAKMTFPVRLSERQIYRIIEADKARGTTRNVHG